ncbi:cation:dicarboxylase symporter family transporter, partial [Halomonas elongata]
MFAPLTSLWRGYRDSSLILRVTLALVLGAVVGLIGGPAVGQALAPLGELLMRLLKFIILPIVLFTLMAGINQGQAGRLGRIGRKVFLYYLVTSALAIIVGLTVASLLSPGEGMSLEGAASVSVPENPGILSVVLGIVPTNIIGAFAEQNLLGIIFTALVFGLAVAGLRQSQTHGELGERLAGLIEALNVVTLKVM